MIYDDTEYRRLILATIIWSYDYSNENIQQLKIRSVKDHRQANNGKYHG